MTEPADASSSEDDATPTQDAPPAQDATSGETDLAPTTDTASGPVGDPDSAPVDDAKVGSAGRSTASPSAALPPHRFWLLAVIALVVYLLDQLTKIIAVANLMEGGESPRILGGLIYFSLIRNPGAAFSMATGMTWILAVIASIVVVVIIRIATRLRSVWWAISLGLILGGALGNLTDRIFRSPGFFRGHVVDFISVFGPNAEHFPAFNIADSAITVGGVLLVITALQGIEFDGSRTSRKSGPDAQSPDAQSPDAQSPGSPSPTGRTAPDVPNADRRTTDG